MTIYKSKYKDNDTLSTKYNDTLLKNIKSLYESNLYNRLIIKSFMDKLKTMNISNEFVELNDFIEMLLENNTDYNVDGVLKNIYRCNGKILSFVKNSNNNKNKINDNDCTFLNEKQYPGRVYNALFEQWNKSIEVSTKKLNNIEFEFNKAKFKFILDNWNTAKKLINNSNSLILSELNQYNIESINKHSLIGSIELMETLKNSISKIDIKILHELIKKIHDTDNNDYLLRGFLLYKFLRENNIPLFNKSKYLTKSGKDGTFLTQIFSLYHALKKVIEQNQMLNNIHHKHKKQYSIELPKKKHPTTFNNLIKKKLNVINSKPFIKAF
jgi:hypothetical protein